MPAGAGSGVWRAQHSCEPHCINSVHRPISCQGPGKRRNSGTHAGSTPAVYAQQPTLLCLHQMVTVMPPARVQSRQE